MHQSQLLKYLQLWLIETNINPALHTPSPTLQEVIPPMLQEAVG